MKSEIYSGFQKKKQQSLFVKAAEAVLIAKVIKLIAADEKTLSQYDQRSPAVLFARAVKKTIGAAGGDRIGRAYFAYNAVKTLQQAVKPTIKEQEESNELDPTLQTAIKWIDEAMIEPEYADLIPLIKESTKGEKFKLLNPKNRKTFMKGIITDE